MELDESDLHGHYHYKSCIAFDDCRCHNEYTLKIRNRFHHNVCNMYQRNRYFHILYNKKMGILIVRSKYNWCIEHDGDHPYHCRMNKCFLSNPNRYNNDKQLRRCHDNPCTFHNILQFDILVRADVLVSLDKYNCHYYVAAWESVESCPELD